MARILVIDDEQGMRDFLSIMLQKEGYEVFAVHDGETALKRCKESPFDLVISDIKMPKKSGLEILREIKEISKDTPVILITAYASTETAMEAMKKEAYDYLPKPFNIEEMKQVIRKALERREERKKDVPLGKAKGPQNRFDEIIGKSPQMIRIYDLIQKVAPTKTNILITGESGTGKELVARAIHKNSPRAAYPIVTINCGGLPENLLESELFGYQKGAFTGAEFNKPGLLEIASKGTVFLDEVGELPSPLQVKILRVSQEMTFKRIGGTEDIHVDMRIISATNKNLEEEVIKGDFREDLYYRLNVIHIPVPPLRERKEDIPLLAQHFLEKYSKELGKKVYRISSYAVDVLKDYNFPGNVRELENIIQRSVALESSNIILPESLKIASSKEEPHKGILPSIDIPPEGVDLEETINRVEKDLLIKALDRSQGVKKRAAVLLNISFRSFRYKLKKHGIG